MPKLFCSSLYDIVMDTYGAHSLVPAAVHTLETSKSRAEFPAQATTTSGRTIKRPSQSLIYSRTSYEGKKVSVTVTFL